MWRAHGSCRESVVRVDGSNPPGSLVVDPCPCPWFLGFLEVVNTL